MVLSNTTANSSSLMMLYSPTSSSVTEVYDAFTTSDWREAKSAGNQTDDSVTAQEIFPVVYGCVLIITNLSLNGILTLTILCLNRRKFQPSHITILCISVTDLLIAFIHLPTLLVTVIGGTEENCVFVCRMLVVTERAFIAASVWGMASVSCDRYFFIVKHASYKTIVTYRRTIAVVIGVILVAFLFGSTSYFVMSHQRHESGRCLCHLALDFHGFYHLVYSATYITMCFILPTTIMLVLYGFVINVAQKHSSTNRNPFSLHRPNAVGVINPREFHHNKYKGKTAKILVVVLTLYLIFYFPYFMLNILASTGRWEPDGIPQVIYLSSVLLLHTNSSCNPLFYGFTNRRIRTTLLKFFKLDKKFLPMTLNADRISIMGDASNCSDISALSREGLVCRDLISIYTDTRTSSQPTEPSNQPAGFSDRNFDTPRMSEMSSCSAETSCSESDAVIPGQMHGPCHKAQRVSRRLQALRRVAETTALFSVREEDRESVLNEDTSHSSS